MFYILDLQESTYELDKDFKLVETSVNTLQYEIFFTWSLGKGRK